MFIRKKIIKDLVQRIENLEKRYNSELRCWGQQKASPFSVSGYSTNPTVNFYSVAAPINLIINKIVQHLGLIIEIQPAVSHPTVEFSKIDLSSLGEKSYVPIRDNKTKQTEG